MRPNINSLIVGPGAIGSLLCAHIQPYSTVWVHAHKPQMALPAQVNSQETQPLAWQLLDDSTPVIDIIWVCTKANYSIQSVQLLLKRYPKAQVVLLHNGLGPQQSLNAQFPGQIIYGMTTNAAYKAESGLFVQTAFGETFLGCPTHSPENSPARQWLATIASWPGNLQFCIENNIEAALWKKLAINAVVNPLTAYYQIPNGELLDDRFKSTIETMCSEIKLISLAEHIALPSPLADTVFNVIELTAQNYSSMNRDIAFGRITELDYILGFLLNRAQQHAISTPMLTYWFQQIEALQQKCSEK